MRIVHLFGALFIATMAVVGAHAQPAGSYQKTCRNIAIDGNTLTASCRDRGGHYKNSRLDIGPCLAGSIFNENGTLKCSFAAVPTGSYQQSCGSVRVENGTLYAVCQKIGSGQGGSSLNDYAHCWSDISNVNGYLACDQGDRPGPEGTYRATCRDRVVSGTILRASCMNNSRDFKSTSLDVASCRQPIVNSNGRLSCGPVKPPPPPPLPPSGVSAVVFYNCVSSRRAVTLWTANESNPMWSRTGTVPPAWSGNICAVENASSTVNLAPGLNRFRATDPALCDDPTLLNCQIMSELPLAGRKYGPIVPYQILN
jgi:CVNH domain